LAVSAALAGVAGSAAGLGVAAGVPGTAFTVATFADVEVLAGADFDAVFCDCARLDPARARTNAASVAKAKIPRPAHTLIPLLFLSLISSLLFSDLFRLHPGTLIYRIVPVWLLNHVRACEALDCGSSLPLSSPRACSRASQRESTFTASKLAGPKAAASCRTPKLRIHARWECNAFPASRDV